MKKLGLLIVLLLSLSWTASLLEGLRCEETDHIAVEEISDRDGGHKDAHPCHANSCHFGHCGHLSYQGKPPWALNMPLSLAHRESTPYSFTLPPGSFTLPMRPPLAFS